MLTQVLSIVLSLTFLAVQAGRPERTVDGNMIVSNHDPKVRIQLPKSVEYVGADRWDLYNVADCEVHAFVEADAQKNVQRLYWIQFEGYLPTQPAAKYEYDSPKHTRIAGLDFYVDTWVRSSDAETRSGSDRDHVQKLVAAKGYKMPAAMMYVRLVHLLDEQKRRELMIIYGEDLAPTGLTIDQLGPGGSASRQWDQIFGGLVERAQKKIMLEGGIKP